MSSGLVDAVAEERLNKSGVFASKAIAAKRRHQGPMTNLQVVTWSVEKLMPYARNARTHSDEQIAQVAASIVEFGWTSPILVGGDGVIIAGHARLAAARRLRMTEVPVIVLGHLSEAQRRALVLADNKLALNAGWDEEMLRVELQDLEVNGFNLDLIGFSADELETIHGGRRDDPEGLTDEDAVPETQTRCRHCARRRVDPGRAPADCAATPRWNGRGEGAGRRPGGHGLFRPAVQRELRRDHEGQAPRHEHGPSPTTTWARTSRSSSSMRAPPCWPSTKGAIYICMSSSEMHTLQKAFREAGGHWSTFVIWAKNTFTMGRSDYQRQYEPILYGWKEGTDHFWCGARDQGDVWFIKKPHVNDLHPTMKPVELVERAIRNSSKTRDTILDPFGGSGTTMIACEKAGRQARLIELDPKYCDVIVRRWQAFAGAAATLEGEGTAFDTIAAQRQAA